MGEPKRERESINLGGRERKREKTIEIVVY